MTEPNVGNSLPGTESEVDLVRRAREMYGDLAVDLTLHNAARARDPDFFTAYDQSAADAVRPGAPVEVAVPPPSPEESFLEAMRRRTQDAYRAVGGDPTKAPLDDLKGIAGTLGKKAVDALAVGPLNKAAVSAMGFADKEKAAVAQAADQRGSGQALSADPVRPPGSPARVVGMTKGGFQPTARGETAQVESKVMPPEWREALAQFTMHGKSAAEGGAAVGSELAALSQRAAEQRAASLQEAAQAEELALASEDRARQAAEQRIALAIRDFEQSAPRAENYGTLFAGRDPGERMGGVAGSLLGIFGGALSGTPSKFAAQLDKQLERRAAAAEAASRVKGQVVGMQENAYARLERTFANSAAARAALRSIYTEQAKAELESAAAAIGIGAEHPKLQEALAALEEKRLGYLRELASTVTQQARSEEKYAPPRAIVVPGAGGGLEAGLTPKQKDDLRDLGKIFREEEIPQARAAVTLMKEASDEIGEDSAFWATVASANPETIGQIYSRFAADPPRQKFLAAFNEYLASKSGKAVTKSEGGRISQLLGSGDKKARETAISVMDRGVQSQLRTLQETGWDESMLNYLWNKAANDARGRSGRDIRGVESQQSVTEPPPVAR